MNRFVTKLFLPLFSTLFLLGVPLSLGAPLLTPDNLNARSALEEKVVQKYRTELLTVLQQGTFAVSAQVSLVEKNSRDPAGKGSEAAEFSPFDLRMGRLNPKSWRLPQDAAGDGPEYMIRSVSLFVGLDSALSQESRDQVKTWLTTHMTNEFGSLGKVEISTIQAKPVEKADAKNTPTKSWLDRLTELQVLAGMVVMAVMILFSGLLLMRGLSIRSEPPQMAELPRALPPTPVAAEPKAEIGPKVEQLLSATEQKELRASINELAIQTGDDLQALITSWADGGETGLLKLALFLDIASGLTKKLKVPEKAQEGLAETFSKIHNISAADRLDAMARARWDLVACRNLGSQSLHQPFDYLENVQDGAVKSILLNENPRLRATVALHMPSKVRKKYLDSMAITEKQGLFDEMVSLSSLKVVELRQADQKIQGLIGASAPAEAALSTQPLLARFLDDLVPEESLKILQTALQASDIRAFSEIQKLHPSPAFLPYWPKDELTALLREASTDELLSFIHFMPEMQETAFAVLPDMSCEILKDTLPRADKQPIKEHRGNLESLQGRLSRFLEKTEIELKSPESLSPAPESVLRAA